MANLNNYSFQNQPLQQYIIQPQGLMYLINSYNELNNIPLNNVNIVAFCFSENKCYIRTLQGGAPVVTTYNLIQQENKSEKEEKNLMDLIKSIDERLKKMINTKKMSRGFLLCSFIPNFQLLVFLDGYYRHNILYQ